MAQGGGIKAANEIKDQVNEPSDGERVWIGEDLGGGVCTGDEIDFSSLVDFELGWDHEPKLKLAHKRIVSPESSGVQPYLNANPARPTWD